MFGGRDKPLVLVIDDEEPIRDGCTQALEKSGYRVIAGCDGTEGIKRAREEKPGLVFVDLKMPGLSGMEVIDIISTDLPDTVIVVITGFASIVSAVEATKKGAYDYLPKPFSPDQLRTVAKRATDHRNLAIETKRLREEKEQIQRNFITFVSHEMRSPLATIQQYIEALKAVASASLSLEARDIIDRCEKRLGGIQELVEHWLDISRIDAGEFTQKKKPINLNRAMERAVDDMRPLCEKRDIALAVFMSPELPDIIGDEESLVRVFINIIGNATKYTPPGGTIKVRVESDALYEVITIEDTGAGIPADKLPFIFDAFFRVRGKDERQKGSGLGLTFCKKIVEAHGGTIEAASQEGMGTTFVVRLPR
ncbi:MAG: response regulator [Deltaproteobacteria bacterium]|nr:response regulator [Deltaproteobacteria bacterium]